MVAVPLAVAFLVGVAIVVANSPATTGASSVDAVGTSAAPGVVGPSASTDRSTPTAAQQTPSAPTGPSSPAALRELQTLAVDGGTNNPRYERAYFGEAWVDVDANGCDTRNDILRRDLVDVRFRSDNPDCIVRSGVLEDAYTGATIPFTRGWETSEAVQIDHIVPLAYAWRHGASGWSDAQRLAFANDPVNLQAVDGPTNGAKSDSGPAEWMPPNSAYACPYVQRFVHVAAVYGLTVTQSDLDAMARIVSDCG
ncbi:HNH endonuclease family protein [Agromyces sp. Marseille-Q5079]|uniref:HNH endonuclease family protein n=1 Tax=Agromyces sp. Marseille-Q5079 TaxID=3439059 RepID=UPI003D9C98EB